ncbi:MAG: hypothetical protein AAGB19_01195 [Cyanobacteria bacterium P01_F01_bin.3]
MALKTQPATTEMQVTSIRFERELIDKLKALAGNQGYQSLVREILWNYVKHHSDEPSFQIKKEDIRTIMAAEAYKQEKCSLTGVTIRPHQEMWMALTVDDQLVPLSIDSLSGS